MKFLTLLFSFYILILSCLPCGDRKECNTEEAQKISVTTTHQEHNHTTEACTPFCTCSCCVASAFYQPLTSFSTSNIVFQSVQFQYEVVFNSYDLHSIWQPPQLG